MLSLTGGKCGTVERMTGDGFCTDFIAVPPAPDRVVVKK